MADSDTKPVVITPAIEQELADFKWQKANKIPPPETAVVGTVETPDELAIKYLEAALGEIRDRRDNAGRSSENFYLTAKKATSRGFTVNGEPVSSADVADFMICLKEARIETSETQSEAFGSKIDAVGYAAFKEALS